MAGRLVLDGKSNFPREWEIYVYPLYKSERHIFVPRGRVSLLDDIEDREISPIFGIPLPPYERLLEEYPCRETYQGLEAGRASRYYPYFCQLASQMDEMMTDDEDEEDEIPVDTWDRPDMTDE